MTENSQRGVALLTILLLVVSITIVAGAMLASQKIAIRRSGVLFDQNQLLQDIQAGQQLAVTILRADSALNDTDSAQDIWAQTLPPYSLGSHTITMEIRDEAARFNVNNLYHDDETDPVALAVFQRLLSQLNLEPELAVAILDWQDSDREVYNDGGDESVVYGAQSGSHTDKSLPNQPFISIEQLQEVRGVDAEVLAALRPYITAVPYYLPINLNTASPVLLSALMEGGKAEQMQSLTELRDKNPLPSVDTIWKLPQLAILSTEQRQALTPLLAVDSNTFSALITANDGATSDGRQRFATALISKMNANSNADMTAKNNSDSNSNADNGMINGNSDNNTGTKNGITVQIVSQQLWAFRPNF